MPFPKRRPRKIVFLANLPPASSSIQIATVIKGLALSCTSPISTAGTPAVFRSRTRFVECSAATAINNPPAVCGSKRIVLSSSGIPSSYPTTHSAKSRLLFRPPGMWPARMQSRAPSRIGIWFRWNRSEAFDASAISRAWPIRPKPVTSVREWMGKFAELRSAVRPRAAASTPPSALRRMWR